MVAPDTKVPPANYTNSQWQTDFNILKSQTKQSKYHKMPVISDKIDNQFQTYHEKTQYQTYCDFINGILKTIRNGEKDYCFYIYQIVDLLKYEHNNLKAEWLQQEHCFCVCLDKLL